MPAPRIEPFYGRDCGTGNRPNRSDARTCRPPFDVDRAGATKAYPATELGSGKSQLIANHPKQRSVLGTMNGDGSAVELNGGHNRVAPIYATQLLGFGRCPPNRRNLLVETAPWGQSRARSTQVCREAGDLIVIQ